MFTAAKVSRRLSSNFKRTNRRKAFGFTLIELIIVIVIIAIGVALAVPAFESVMQRRQVTSQAEQLAAFLSQAQSEAIKRNEQVRINFDYTGATDWCMGAATGGTVCDCNVKEDTSLADDPRTDSFCDIGGATGIAGSRQIINNSAFNKSAMVSNADSSFSFDPIRGSMTTADLASSLAARTFVVESTNEDYRLQVEVTVLGGVRICNPVTTKTVHGYPACA